MGFDRDDSVSNPSRVADGIERRARFAELLGRISVVEVTGKPDFPALFDVVGDLLAR